MKHVPFNTPGVHAIVDGQFGSTGKGVIAAKVVEEAVDQGIRGTIISVCNAGPNSGHTFYHNGEKHVLKQLPTTAVKAHLMGVKCLAILSAGSIIDPEILYEEISRYKGINVMISPNAAVITKADKEAERFGSIGAVAGTRSGTGMALARKVMREKTATVAGLVDHDEDWENYAWLMKLSFSGAVTEYIGSKDVVFLEVSQGFSLGINSQFYPKVTSRECTVQQGLADARLPITMVRNVVMSCRTFPIRVGNVDGFSSGDCYPDQVEIKWEDIRVEPELTTVTKRIRRVFTLSGIQMNEAVACNDPSVIFMNFMNYLDEEHYIRFRDIMDRNCLDAIPGVRMMYGYGPTSDDVENYDLVAGM